VRESTDVIAFAFEPLPREEPADAGFFVVALWLLLLLDGLSRTKRRGGRLLGLALVRRTLHVVVVDDDDGRFVRMKSLEREGELTMRLHSLLIRVDSGCKETLEAPSGLKGVDDGQPVASTNCG
jgi:hypothetical protein